MPCSKRPRVWLTRSDREQVAPKISWPMGEQDALDLLSIVSFLHRRLDDAVLTQVEH